MVRANLSPRRANGVYYTPPDVALLASRLALRRFLLARGQSDVPDLDRLLPLPIAVSSRSCAATPPLNPRPPQLDERQAHRTLAVLQDTLICDLAVGEGVFLLAVVDAVRHLVSCLEPGGERAFLHRFVPAMLWGMDVDPRSAGRTIEAVLETIDPTTSADTAVSLVAHVRQGDGLLDVLQPTGRHDAFDLVIGNPPWGAILDKAVKRELREHFDLSGIADSFALFLLRAVEILAPQGALAMVLPDILLLKDYPNVRRRLLEAMAITDLVLLGPLFDSVSLDAIMLVGQKEADRERRLASQVTVWRYRMADRSISRERAVGQDELLSNRGYRFDVHLSSPNRRLQRKMELAGIPLVELLEAHEGIHSGNIRPKLFVSSPVPDGGPLIFGRDEVSRFAIRWAGRYVRYDPRCIDRSAGEYANLGRVEWYRPPKLLIRRTGDFLLAAMDRAGYFCSNNLFVARMRPGYPNPGNEADDLLYLMAILNSSALTWFYRSIQPRVGRPFAELKLIHLRRLPVPWPPRQGRQPLVNLAADLMRFCQQGPAPARSRAYPYLDGLVSTLYALNTTERGIIGGAKEAAFPAND